MYYRIKDNIILKSDVIKISKGNDKDTVPTILISLNSLGTVYLEFETVDERDKTFETIFEDFTETRMSRLMDRLYNFKEDVKYYFKG